jgi:hypothetical protein
LGQNTPWDKMGQTKRNRAKQQYTMQQNGRAAVDGAGQNRRVEKQYTMQQNGTNEKKQGETTIHHATKWASSS